MEVRPIHLTTCSYSVIFHNSSLVPTISLGRNKSSSLRTTRETLSPGRVLRSMDTNSSWLTPVISTPLTYTKKTMAAIMATIMAAYSPPGGLRVQYTLRTSRMRSPGCRRPSLTAAPRGRMFLTRMGPGAWTEESLVTTVKPRPSEPRWTHMVSMRGTMWWWYTLTWTNTQQLPGKPPGGQRIRLLIGGVND